MSQDLNVSEFFFKQKQIKKFALSKWNLFSKKRVLKLINL